MEEWKEYRLGEVVNILDSKRVPLSSKERSNRKGSFPYYGAQGIIDYIDDYIFDGTYLLVAEDGENLKSHKQQISQIAKGKYWVNNHAHILESNGKCDIRYICYLLNTIDISGYVTGSAQPKLNQENLKAITLKLPSLATQIRIADFISMFDDKIALNRKINSNLEEQAKALFKSWFIDFEPFKGGKFVDSELGKIPEGWEVCPLEQMGKFKRGKTIVAKNTKEGTVPVVAGGMEPAYYNNVANTKGPVITVSASGANAGFMRLYFQDIWASDCSFLDNTNENLLWIYCFLDNNRRVLRHAQTGAVQPHVKPADINSILVCVPVHELIDKFQNVVRPLFLTIGLLQSETMRLQRTRDTLLPKLMSGEIKV